MINTKDNTLVFQLETRELCAIPPLRCDYLGYPFSREGAEELVSIREYFRQLVPNCSKC